jgi:hypothetical protein
MKKAIVLLALLAVLIPAGSAFAFDPPAQSTDNATDVVVWHGDNLTINSVAITGLTDSNEKIADDYLSFIIMAFIVILALTIKGNAGLVVSGIAVPVTMVYGFRMASEYVVYTSLWMMGLCIGLGGVFFLFKLVMQGFSKKKA